MNRQSLQVNWHLNWLMTLHLHYWPHQSLIHFHLYDNKNLQSIPINIQIGYLFCIPEVEEVLSNGSQGVRDSSISSKRFLSSGLAGALSFVSSEQKLFAVAWLIDLKALIRRHFSSEDILVCGVAGGFNDRLLLLPNCRLILFENQLCALQVPIIINKQSIFSWDARVYVLLQV